jgi:hypothetical protein
MGCTNGKISLSIDDKNKLDFESNDKNEWIIKFNDTIKLNLRSKDKLYLLSQAQKYITTTQ